MSRRLSAFVVRHAKAAYHGFLSIGVTVMGVILASVTVLLLQRNEFFWAVVIFLIIMWGHASVDYLVDEARKEEREYAEAWERLYDETVERHRQQIREMRESRSFQQVWLPPKVDNP